mgnify:CR=1 FL=1
MIKKINIKNYAIIKELEIPFKEGLTVITGETGSGKSLILEALGVSLGNKTHKMMIRNGEEKAIIETDFRNSKIKRIVLKNGRTKSFYEGQPITLNNLRVHKDIKIDFHGQNDQQFIMNPESHIDYLDHYCGHVEKINHLKSIYVEIKVLEEKLLFLEKTSDEINEKRDFLNFQAKEIDSIALRQNEDVILHGKFKKLTHVKEIIDALNISNDKLFNKDDTVISQINHIKNIIISLEKYDPTLNKISLLLENSIINIQETQGEISNQLSSLDLEPEEIQFIEERLTSIESLKRKYGGSIESVLEKRDEIRINLKNADNPEKDQKSIVNQIIKLKNTFNVMATDIHESREKVGYDLSLEIQKTMRNLNMPESLFHIKISNSIENKSFVKYKNKFYQYNSKGFDSVEFYLSTNPGEPLKPLSLVASGGEVSRIMLAIKTVFEKIDPAKTLVFDEIDSGISGLAATKVASHLVELSKHKQVLCITHLAQIASQADHHLHIDKYTENHNTYVNFKYVTKKDRTNIMNKLFLGTSNGELDG